MGNFRVAKPPTRMFLGDGREPDMLMKIQKLLRTGLQSKPIDRYRGISEHLYGTLSTEFNNFPSVRSEFQANGCWLCTEKH